MTLVKLRPDLNEIEQIQLKANLTLEKKLRLKLFTQASINYLNMSQSKFNRQRKGQLK